MFRRFGIVFVTLLLLSGFNIEIHFDLDSVQINDSNDNTPNLVPRKFTPIPEIVNDKLILTYDSFNSRDDALKLIPDQFIKFVFKYIPVVTIWKDKEIEIPKTGLLQVNINQEVYKTSSSQEEFVLKEIFDDGFTLADTAKMVGIDYLRNELDLSGEGITIAILDSGIAENPIAFDDRITYLTVQDLVAKDVYDEDGHGTHVSAIAAGNGIYKINGEFRQTDSTGMAPASSILSIRVLDEDGNGENDWILQGMEIAINNSVDIISMSLSTPIYEGENDPIEAMVQVAVDNGIIVVAASGNTGPYGSGIGIPGGLSNVIGVGATFPRSIVDQEVWTFSGVGPATNDYPGPDILAPGVGIYSVNYTDGTVSILSGTSMATPHVSGGIALLKEAFPEATISHIREALLASAKLTSSGGQIDQIEAQGRGIVKFDIAYNILKDSLRDNPDDHTNMAVIPNLIRDWNYIYRSNVINTTKTFPFFIFSSRSLTIESNIDKRSFGVNIDLPSSITISEGINRLDIEFTINSTANDYIGARIYFTDASTNEILQFSNITLTDTESIPQNGKILFDYSHDQDTPSAYFANHGTDGQFSQLTRILEKQGYIVDNSEGFELTDDLLADYDLLVIANPDRPYKELELAAIKNFTDALGRSMLIIVDGGLFDSEGEPTYSQFHPDLTTIIEGTGIEISSGTTERCIYSDLIYFEDRITDCVVSAEVVNNQIVYDESYRFAHFGPELKLAGDQNRVNDVFSLATIDDNRIVAAASEFTSGGRLIVFSSSLLFDNEAVLYGYNRDASSIESRKIAFETIDWLLEPRKIQLNYEYDGVLENEIEVLMYEPFIVTFSPRDNKGTFLDLGDVVTMRIRTWDLETGEIDFADFDAVKSTESSYSISYTLSRNIQVDFYLAIAISGNVATNGHFRVIASLPNFENQSSFRIVGRIFFGLIVISWLFWYKNEGGRQRKLKKVI